MAAWAAPPAPSNTTDPRAGSMRRTRSAATMPATSVLSASHPCLRGSMVLAAPVTCASDVRRVAAASATRFSGMVTEKPAHPWPARPSTRSKRSSVQSIAV